MSRCGIMPTRNSASDPPCPSRHWRAGPPSHPKAAQKLCRVACAVPSGLLPRPQMVGQSSKRQVGLSCSGPTDIAVLAASVFFTLVASIG